MPRCLLPLAALLIAAPAASAQDAAPFDVVIAGGRVIDPASGLDAVRNVGIVGGTIAAIDDPSAHGTHDDRRAGSGGGAGLHRPPRPWTDAEHYRAQAQDGVTTALELEVGTGDVDRWYDERAGAERSSTTAPAGGHIPARMRRDDTTTGTLVPSGRRRASGATPEEIAEILPATSIRRARRGALASGFGTQLHRRGDAAE